MASSELTFDLVHSFLLDNGGKVRNHDAVRYFKSYLTDPLNKDANRVRFKDFVNTLAHTKTDGDEKILILKSKYLRAFDSDPFPAEISYSPQHDPRNSIGIPLSPPSLSDFSSTVPSVQSSPRPRQPPPYRPPPPVNSSTSSLDTISLGSLSSANETPQAPPRRRESTRKKSAPGIPMTRPVSVDETVTPVKQRTNSVDEVTPVRQTIEIDENGDKKSISVKERTKEFNRLASVEDELSPRAPKSAEKEKPKRKSGVDEEDTASVKQIDPKRCMEWYVTMSKGDYQELMRLVNTEPKLVKKKDPFTAYSVLHWGAKYGNAEIVKTFAGRYNVDVNGKTNGGYTPLHICAQFGHQSLFKLLIEVYKADTNIRDYSGRTAEYYLLTKEKRKETPSITLRKIKGRKKQSEKDLSFLRIGSLNVRVKRTTEAFSNFLGVGNAAVNPTEPAEKVHKGWGSADNVNKDHLTASKSYSSKKKSKRIYDSGGSSTPGTPKSITKNFSRHSTTGHESDSDSAAGFDSSWKN